MKKSFSEAFAGRGYNAPVLSTSQKLHAWWRVCRPPFFITAALPVTLGFAISFRQTATADWIGFGLILIGCCMGLTIANFANELFDYLEGVDTEDTIGGTHVIQSQLISPRQIAFALILLVGGCAAVGWMLLERTGQSWLLWAILFSVLSAVFYVAPPIRYGCRGYGELAVALNMGFIMVAGTSSVLAHTFIPQSLAFALPLGLMVAGILYYQSLPEIDTDRIAGKFTLANLLGKSRAELIFQIWWPAVWGLMLNLWACGVAGWPVVLGLLTIPFYWKACRLIRHARRTDAWLDLDQHGHLVRKLYLINGIILIGSVFF